MGLKKKAKATDIQGHGYSIKDVKIPTNDERVNGFELKKNCVMDEFTRNEIIGRVKFKSLLKQVGITNYYFTPEKYNPVDCYFNNSS